MSDLTFACLGGQPDRYAASPTLLLRLQLSESTGEQVHAIALRCQIRIEPLRRRYSETEGDRLLDLFGEPGRWGDTMKPIQFANLSLTVPSFRERIEIDLPVPCTYDFDVVSAKYLHALDDGEIPLLLLFSGTIFLKGATGYAVEQVPWHKEAAFRLPARVWREMMDVYFPNSGWIRLHRETLDALQQYKARQAFTSWDQALEALLEQARQAAP